MSWKEAFFFPKLSVFLIPSRERNEKEREKKYYEHCHSAIFSMQPKLILCIYFLFVVVEHIFRIGN